jgi:hypothetical protein
MISDEAVEAAHEHGPMSQETNARVIATVDESEPASDLVKFLSGRIAEREGSYYRAQVRSGSGYALLFAKQGIADAIAHRKILKLHEAFGRAPEPEARDMWHAAGAILKLLASAYKDHEDYQQEWSK